MKISPAIALFILAPTIGELLSGPSPPVEFFNPITFILLVSLYGSGAIIVREVKIRWKKGYVSMFVLGAAYGILEEGLMVKSFFDPGWMDLGILGVFGRWAEVNWVWAEWLTIYHAIFSVSIPIVLVELAYPKRRNERWIGNKKFAGLLGLLRVVTFFGFSFLTDYRPPFLQYFLTIMSLVLLILLAWRIPPSTGKHGRRQILKPALFALIGFVSVLTLFLLFWVGPSIISHFPLVLTIGIGLVLVLFYSLKQYNWSPETLYHKYTLVAGAILFLIILTPLQELDPNRPDNTQGMLIVGIIALLLLLLLRRALKSHLTNNTYSNSHLSSFKESNRFCSSCGQYLPKRALFCPECGYKRHSCYNRRIHKNQ